jgi:hypothetical protein
MAYENIRLRKQNFTVVNGYFWMVDQDVDAIIVKTDDGTQAYSYPLDTTITNEIISLEFDGYNIWSLEVSATDQVTIRRWNISNYVCCLRNTFVMVPGASHKYSSNAFTVEHYHETFSAAEAAGQSVLSVSSGSKMDSGFKLILGPNVLGQIEEVSVSSATTDSVSINGVTLYAYEEGDPISFYRRIWLFNNYDGISSATGALYKIDAYTGAYITKTAGGAYKDINACTFFDVPRYVFDRSVGPETPEPRYNSLCYVKGTNAIFLNPDNLNSSYGSMAMDNIKSDLATTITVYDLAMEGTNVFRLQRDATYYGTTYTFVNSTYNYQLSSLNSFITSISLRSNPSILPANGVNTAEITAIVKDQFDLPIQARQVFFTDDDPTGAILSSPINTDSNGVAVTTYKAGTTAREVRVTSTCQQA